MRIKKTQKDREGKSVVEFIENHPECEGSPLNRNITRFKRLNEEKDAELANKAKMTRLEAENAAFNLNPKELEEMCSLLGYPTGSEQMMRHRLLEVAGNDPDFFMGYLEAPDRKVRALIRKAVASKVITLRGTVHKFNETIIGADEDEAVAELLKDKDLKVALEKATK